MPDTICVQERLPPGAAAVLINPTHAYRDLILPMDSTEKGLFDGVDGNRSIGSIVKRTLPPSPTKLQLDKARTFFEKLWYYDQIVVDASRQSARGEEAGEVGGSGNLDPTPGPIDRAAEWAVGLSLDPPGRHADSLGH
jgi:hypothetical protein